MNIASASVSSLASYALPSIVAAAGLMLALSKKDLLSQFLSGCTDGIKTTFGLMPTLLLLVVGVKMFSASGALSALCTVLSPLCRFFGMPEEILPVFLMRPISGSGATAMIRELFAGSGPDSTAGRTASILMGSSDTIFYTLSVYFAHTGTKKTGGALLLSFLLLFFCTALSCLLAAAM